MNTSASVDTFVSYETVSFDKTEVVSVIFVPNSTFPFFTVKVLPALDPYNLTGARAVSVEVPVLLTVIVQAMALPRFK
tara:strand:- start:2977 stop:3210 length:234 start_codon:yes stop_codon:yes gene_type:complete